MSELRNNEFHPEGKKAADTEQLQASVQPVEPEDPSAGGQDEQKPALEHNVEGKQGQGHPAQAPAQHATGSFTDKK